ncbi:uncharacterized protein LOC121306342 [Polyodon spathula]|uniref:uncharacterized protein LOC121306342 n=1 Tax=Polyodon spathula TaxID=7913 RepID=UPI001B7D94B9|nr:uncharacterized protein LOC121306342 [Polyodon spathula]
MESVQIKEEFFEPELLPFRVEFFGLTSLPIKRELCEMQCDSSQSEVFEMKAEHNELEIPQTEEPLPVKQEEVLEIVSIKWEPPEVEFDHVEPGKEESEDLKPNIPELEPVRLRECSVVLERICVREQGAGEEGFPNSTQGDGQGERRSHSECSLADNKGVLVSLSPRLATQCGYSLTVDFLGNAKFLASVLSCFAQNTNDLQADRNQCLLKQFYDFRFLLCSEHGRRGKFCVKETT